MTRSAARWYLTSTIAAEVAQAFSKRSEPFILDPKSDAEIPRATALTGDGDVAVAPFALDQGRMGLLVAGAPKGETFGELQLKMLAGLADQATLALG